ncbi:LysR family transcriptional regulator [Nocardioides pantholopis]|uniref:LysR family transcriptional regulator n=1 Tax=Nocardioides pantholopis TaxID=2483798 RepID=UPI0013DDFAC7|nr:LysR family transcriptional regulator [Nocardioides pantholopis]
MDLRSLRYFAAVVAEGGITQAAEALYVSQPSLSQAMRQLEESLGVPLLDRSGRRAVPTAEGLRLHALARQVLAEADAAAERVRQVAAVEVGRLVLATSSTLSVHPLTELVAELRRRHHGLEVQIQDGATPAGVLDLLRAGDAEVGVVDGPAPEAEWSTQELTPEEVVLAVMPREGAPLPDPVPRGGVAALDLGVAVPDLEAAGPVAEAVSAMGGRVRARCAHRAMLWELVRHASVAAFIGRRTAELVLPGVPLHSLEPPLWRHPVLVWRPEALSSAGSALLAVVGERGIDERAREG